MNHAPYTTADFDRAPLMCYFETTQACDLVCDHCRASAQTDPDPGELDTDRAEALLDQIASFERRPMVVLTGGDPLKRRDLFELIAHARGAGLHLALTPSATPPETSNTHFREPSETISIESFQKSSDYMVHHVLCIQSNKMPNQ